MATTVYNVMPIPPDDAATRFVDAGALRIGVEYRFLDDAELRANYGGDAAAMDEIDANRPAAGIEDEGVSIHVFGDDGREYLRVDMFDAGPHYHYVAHDRGENVIVDYDPVALGAMLPWTLAQLRTRVRPMLEQAGAAELARRIDGDALESSLVEVERLVETALQEIERQRGLRP